MFHKQMSEANEPINMRTIASLCNVSTATVSRVLHGSEKVSHKTRTRVLDIIRKHGYLPNPLAQGLIKKRTWLIGVLVPDMYNQFVPTVVEPFAFEMEKARYQCILNATKNDPVKERRAIEETLRYYCEGLVFIGTRLVEDQNRSYIEEVARKIPVVMINALETIANAFHVYNDECAAISSVVDYLVSMKKRNLSMVLGPMTHNTFREKKKGFLSGLQRNNIQAESAYIIEGCEEYHDFRDVVEYLFRKNPPPNAIVTGGDLVALGILKALARKNIRVPRDVMLVGYDNIPFAAMSVPGLTTVDQHGEVLGKTAAEVLRKALKGIPVNRDHKFLPTICKRETA
jgi:DNA-binding LacI/PurR family transcriptional regulator